jgi:hypothetical protein
VRLGASLSPCSLAIYDGFTCAPFLTLSGQASCSLSSRIVDSSVAIYYILVNEPGPFTIYNLGLRLAGMALRLLSRGCYRLDLSEPHKEVRCIISNRCPREVEVTSSCSIANNAEVRLRRMG